MACFASAIWFNDNFLRMKDEKAIDRAGDSLQFSLYLACGFRGGTSIGGSLLAVRLYNYAWQNDDAD